MAHIAIGLITSSSAILCRRDRDSVDVFQVPQKSYARIARSLGRQPAYQLNNCAIYRVQTSVGDERKSVTFGELAALTTAVFTIEDCNKDGLPRSLGYLPLRSGIENDNRGSVGCFLAHHLHNSSQRAVACVRGVALLRWLEGDKWAAYHLVSKSHSLKA